MVFAMAAPCPVQLGPEVPLRSFGGCGQIPAVQQGGREPAVNLANDREGYVLAAWLTAGGPAAPAVPC